jgi:hypothetical protein
MPSHEEHCQESLKRYGKSFSELHRWMDEPSTILGPHHRRQRHNPYTTPKITAELFGHLADQACFDHIRLDELESRRKGFNSGTSSSRRTGQPKSMSSGAWALFALITFVFGLLSISTNVFGSLFCFLLSFLSFLAFLGSTNPPKPLKISQARRQ